MRVKNVTLEMSLKPFGDPSPEAVRQVCARLFEQWRPLTASADTVSVLLWVADGSEILEYGGDLQAPFEWARYIGGANPRGNIPGDPEGIALHSRYYLYMDDPPTLTYGWLRDLTAALREEGRRVAGKPVRVGATFDPGPEFAASPFKYERHPEICLASTMGRASFVGCYATLHSDDRAYAGYPDGIPEGTPFGAFLGKQARHFLNDLGFDYIWFSNGFGFGIETWGFRGPLFDGQAFDMARAADIRDKNLAFWRLFRQECPDYPIETRGTNLSTAMDLASDAVPLADIYRGDFHMAPPPNSPWAALNGDFGLELVGWMSHIAEIPGEEFPFRFYTHDPWWLNSPWLDRYGREPHDIYLPMAVARIDAKGRVANPSAIEFLTVDDSYGRMPDQVPVEVIPHVASAMRDAPDRPGPLVWVYPFDAYHDMIFGDAPRPEEVFFGDWFARDAVNMGLPLNTVVAAGAFAGAMDARPELMRESIAAAPTAALSGECGEALMKLVRGGGRAMFYGPACDLSKQWQDFLNLGLAEPLSGDMQIDLQVESDLLTHADYPTQLRHDPVGSGGPMREVLARASDPATQVLARAMPQGEDGDDTWRVAALSRQAPEWRGGALVWVRGSNAFDTSAGGHHPRALDPMRYFPAPVLMRLALSALGIELRVAMRGPDTANPLLVETGSEEERDIVLVDRGGPAVSTPLTVVARHDNGFFFSGHVPDTTARLAMRWPQGAPLLVGCETRLEAGRATYSMPRAWHRECRVFVDQEADGEVSCVEQHSGQVGVARRLRMRGLRNATVRFYAPEGAEGSTRFLVHPRQPYLVGDFVEPAAKSDRWGDYLEASGLSGSLMIYW